MSDRADPTLANADLLLGLAAVLLIVAVVMSDRAAGLARLAGPAPSTAHTQAAAEAFSRSEAQTVLLATGHGLNRDCLVLPPQSRRRPGHRP